MNPGEAVISGGLWLALPIALAAGLLSFLSPCVLPLVPGYLGYVSGIVDGAERKRSRMVLGASLFVAGFSVVFLAMLAFVVISSAITTGRTFWEFGFDVSRDWLSIGFSASTLLLAYISYYGAIFALGSFAESIKSLVDLRCLQLLPALGYLPPFTIKKEIKLFNELDSFFVSSSQRIDRQLVPPAAPKSDSDKKKEASE